MIGRENLYTLPVKWYFSILTSSGAAIGRTSRYNDKVLRWVSVGALVSRAMFWVDLHRWAELIAASLVWRHGLSCYTSSKVHSHLTDAPITPFQPFYFTHRQPFINSLSFTEAITRVHNIIIYLLASGGIWWTRRKLLKAWGALEASLRVSSCNYWSAAGKGSDAWPLQILSRLQLTG